MSTTAQVAKRFGSVENPGKHGFCDPNGYLSNHLCIISGYVSDFSRLASMHILELLHLACPEKYFVQPTRSNQKGSHIMKVIVRCLVIALAVTGAIATSFANAAPAKASIVASKTSAMPVPRCPPDDPNGCGMTQW